MLRTYLVWSKHYHCCQPLRPQVGKITATKPSRADPVLWYLTFMYWGMKGRGWGEERLSKKKNMR